MRRFVVEIRPDAQLIKSIGLDDITTYGKYFNKSSKSSYDKTNLPNGYESVLADKKYFS
jgi:hypothetical protein